MLIPWIYLSFNDEFSTNINADKNPNLASQGNSGAGVDDATADKSKKASTSFNSSKLVGGLGTSININKSNIGLLNVNDAN